jgi:PAS domain S-box-containing protein
MSVSQAPGSDAVAVAQFRDWSDTTADSHSVQFYNADEFLLEGLSRFVGTALGGGDAAITVASSAHRHGLAQRLRARGLDVDVAVEQGRYVQLDAAETLAKFMRKGKPDAARFRELMAEIIERARAAAGKGERVVIFGEMVAMLMAEGNPVGAIKLEQFWNDLARSHSFALRCAYPMSGFYREEHAEPFLQICAEHAHVIPTESYTALASEEERQRAVSQLQQKAEALEREVAQRKEMQKSLRRREAELADFLENAVEGMQQVGADQRIRWANKSLLTLLGYAAEEYVGHPVAEFYAELEVFEEYWRRLMGGENVYDYPVRLRCKDGSVKHLLINSNGLWEGGQLVHTRCFLRDVTEHKRMEEALRRSEKLAATGRLAAAIAHEINNPLESLTNLFYLLQCQTSLDESAQRWAEMADKELRRVSHITRQMLSFHRESSRPVPLRVAEILDGVVELYEPRLISRRLSVQRDYTREEQIEGFPSEIRQVLANLLTNAIEACHDQGKIRLHIFACCDWADPARRGIRVCIADNGSGISVENRSKIFEPFFTTKGDAGTGLGLWVSRGIVQKHAGSISFRSSVRSGRSGTVFSVFLPSAAGQHATSQTAGAEIAA